MPSIKYEAIIHWGPENIPSQAVRAKPPIFSETSLANTWAKDQRNAPDRIKTTPSNFPSRLGFPERMAIPRKAMINPIIFSGPQCIIASYFIEGNPFDYIYNATSEAWIIVVYLAVGMNVIGYSCWYSVLSRNPVNNVMSVLLLFPITGLLTSIFILNETPNTYAYFGGAIIISGVAMILINKKEMKNIRAQ